MGQRKLLSLSVLVVRAGSIGPNLLLFLDASGVGRITVAEHYDVDVSNLHWEAIYTEGRRVMSNARSASNAMRSLNPTVLVTSVTYPLTWDTTMELLRGNKCVVDTIDNP